MQTAVLLTLHGLSAWDHVKKRRTSSTHRPIDVRTHASLAILNPCLSTRLLEGLFHGHRLRGGHGGGHVRSLPRETETTTTPSVERRWVKGNISESKGNIRKPRFSPPQTIGSFRSIVLESNSERRCPCLACPRPLFSRVMT